jgi:hypothetical protein
MRWTQSAACKLLHGRTASERTTKACGPGAPVAGAKSARRFAGDGDTKVGLAGARTIYAVNTIVQGMSVDPAEPVVPAACVFCCRRAMGEVVTRHSLRPLLLLGALRCKLGRNPSRECGRALCGRHRGERKRRSNPDCRHGKDSRLLRFARNDGHSTPARPSPSASSRGRA